MNNTWAPYCFVTLLIAIMGEGLASVSSHHAWRVEAG
jgi:hypothetical protein